MSKHKRLDGYPVDLSTGRHRGLLPAAGCAGLCALAAAALIALGDCRWVSAVLPALMLPRAPRGQVPNRLSPIILGGALLLLVGCAGPPAAESEAMSRLHADAAGRLGTLAAQHIDRDYDERARAVRAAAARAMAAGADEQGLVTPAFASAVLERRQAKLAAIDAQRAEEHAKARALVAQLLRAMRGTLAAWADQGDAGRAAVEAGAALADFYEQYEAKREAARAAREAERAAAAAREE